LPKHPTTPLASGQVNQDRLAIELVEPAGMPAAVLIQWPPQPTVVDPAKFRDAAAAMVRLFSDAHITLASIKARRPPES
jgi:hypothetical protein